MTSLGLTSLMQLNALGVDVAATYTTHSTPAFPRYADALRVTKPPPRRTSSFKQLPSPDVSNGRLARQQALQRARWTRQMSHGVLTSMSETDTSTSWETGSGSGSGSGSRSGSGSSGSGSDSGDGDGVLWVGKGDEKEGMVGVLRKRGRRTGVMVRRRFLLRGGVLYKFGKKGEVSWKLSLPGTEVGWEGGRIVLMVDEGRSLVLYAAGEKEGKMWAQGLGRAAGGADGSAGAWRRELAEGNRWDGGIKGWGEGNDRKMQLRIGREDDGLDLRHVTRRDDRWDSFRSFSKLEIWGKPERRQ